MYHPLFSKSSPAPSEEDKILVLCLFISCFALFYLSSSLLVSRCLTVSKSSMSPPLLEAVALTIVAYLVPPLDDQEEPLKGHVRQGAPRSSVWTSYSAVLAFSSSCHCHPGDFGQKHELCFHASLILAEGTLHGEIQIRLYFIIPSPSQCGRDSIIHNVSGDP